MSNFIITEQEKREILQMHHIKTNIPFGFDTLMRENFKNVNQNLFGSLILEKDPTPVKPLSFQPKYPQGSDNLGTGGFVDRSIKTNNIAYKPSGEARTPEEMSKLRINYIKTNGLDTVMEKIREFLNSGWGQVSQIILTSIPGFGQVGAEILWGAFALYDFQKSNIMHFLFDILNMLFMGTASKQINSWFSKLGGKAVSSFEQGVAKLMQTQLGGWLKTMAATLKSSISKIQPLLTKGLIWLEQNVGLKGLRSILNSVLGKVSSFVNTIVNWGKSKITDLAKKVLEKAVNMSEQEILKLVGQKINSKVLHTAQEYVLHHAATHGLEVSLAKAEQIYQIPMPKLYAEVLKTIPNLGTGLSSEKL